MYKVIFDPNVLNYLNSLNITVKKRIYNKIISTKENPYHFFIRLEGRTDFKLRIGKYRVIADINDKIKRIEVTLIDLRSKIYKKLDRLKIKKRIR
jgi:mRNA interferase RelE/StbE